MRVRPLDGLPEIAAGDPLGELIAAAASPQDDEIVVVSQKVASKAEGRVRSLSEVEPGEEAQRLAAQTGKDPRMVELALAESRAVIRAAPGVLICETNDGWICANAGIDASNTSGEDEVTLLPEDADASARRLRAEIKAQGGTSPAIVIADSFGRPWRLGQADIAIGCAGLAALDDWRGRPDAGGRPLAATEIALADQISGAADLARDKDSSAPVAVISGLGDLVTADDGPGAKVMQRSPGEDLFR
ncbi:MAG: coenzyme F420-0:L-glutamate ligase / coenzyme F420:gamma-L-glutamate ligase [Solirubrobacterales bacterium]|jgi:coenzyme F420-0:L-glutamate ligase/coenzyme F420-1:gamma-L-glutamate ligase|nr:coenzyme F420-0:L-glutamate ligase / coenzyme F420:gamma-L-glutamate ligase [Solirubrobacterales bacterium]